MNFKKILLSLLIGLGLLENNNCNQNNEDNDRINFLEKWINSIFSLIKKNYNNKNNEIRKFIKDKKLSDKKKKSIKNLKKMLELYESNNFKSIFNDNNNNIESSFNDNNNIESSFNDNNNNNNIKLLFNNNNNNNIKSLKVLIDYLYFYNEDAKLLIDTMKNLIDFCFCFTKLYNDYDLNRYYFNEKELKLIEIFIKDFNKFLDKEKNNINKEINKDVFNIIFNNYNNLIDFYINFLVAIKQNYKIKSIE